MDNQELKDYIDLKLKIGKLDSTLLFLCSSLSFLFGLIQTIIGANQALLQFSPLLVIGWVLPFYFGYLKGAILDNSVIERVMGWIFLVFGLSIYLSFTASLIIRQMFNNPILNIYIAFLPFLSGVVLGRSVKSFSGKIFEVCHESYSEIDERTVEYTVDSVLYLAIAGSFYVLSGIQEHEVKWLMLFGGSFNAILGSFSLLLAKRMLGKKHTLYHVKEIAGRANLVKGASYFMIISLILLIVLVNIETTIKTPITPYISIVLLIILSISFIISVAFRRRKELIFQKEA